MEEVALYSAVGSELIGLRWSGTAGLDRDPAVHDIAQRPNASPQCSSPHLLLPAVLNSRVDAPKATP